MSNLINDFYIKASKIDKLLENPSNKNLQELTKFTKEPPLYAYFVRTLISKENFNLWLEPLKRNKFFEVANMPELKTYGDDTSRKYRPYWLILNYLEKVSDEIFKQNKVKLNSNIKLYKIINKIINPIINTILKETDDQIVYTYYTLVKIIYQLPYSYMSRDYLKFIEKSLNTNQQFSLIGHEISNIIIKRIINESNKKALIDIFKIILKFVSTQKNDLDKLRSILNNHSFSKLLTEYEKIYNVSGQDIIYLTVNQIRNAINYNRESFSLVKIPTVENSPLRWQLDSYEESLFDFLRNLLQLKLKKEKEISFFLNMFLYENHDIFTRLLLHLVDIGYENYSKLFWDNFHEFMERKTLKHEVYLLVKHNCDKFTKNQINLFLDFIDNKKVYWESKFTRKEREKLNADFKREWLMAVSHLNEKRILNLREKYEDISNSQIEHPGHSIWHTGPSFGYGSSPINEDTLSTFSAKQISQYANEFIELKVFDRPTKEGLANAIGLVISKNPNKYINHLEEFYTNENIYLKSIVNGLVKAYEENVNVDINKILDFLFAITTNINWNYTDNGYNYSYWLVAEFADFVSKKTKNDENKFNDLTFKRIGDLLLIFLNKLKVEEIVGDIDKDIPTLILNTAKGKVLMAIMNYCLQYARTNKNVPNKWLEDFRTEFTKRLDKTYDNSIEFSGILGWYLPYINYLDKNWVEQNFNEIFPLENKRHWESAMSAFLFYNTTVYKNIFDKLKVSNHFAKAINFKFYNEQISQRVAEYIGFSYMQGWENLESGSLMKKLIRDGDVILICYLVRFYWTLKDDLKFNEEYLRILWKELIEKAETNLEDKNIQEFLSDLITWIYFFKKIDSEMFNWLKLSVNYIHINYNLGNLINLCKDKIDSNPKEMSELLLIAFQKQPVDFYSEEDISPIIEKLYSYKNIPLVKENTDKICNYLGLKGFYFLKNLFLEHNS